MRGFESGDKTYQRVVGVVTWLWHKKGGLLGRPVVLQTHSVSLIAHVLITLVDVGGTLSRDGVSSAHEPAIQWPTHQEGPFWDPVLQDP